MLDITIDATADDSGVAVTNPTGFELRIEIGGVSLDITLDQAAGIYQALREWFGDAP